MQAAAPVAEVTVSTRVSGVSLWLEGNLLKVHVTCSERSGRSGDTLGEIVQQQLPRQATAEKGKSDNGQPGTRSHQSLTD